MHRFFAERIDTDTARLLPQEARHALTVLRLTAGEHVQLILEDQLFDAVLADTAPEVTARLEMALPSPEPRVRVTLYQGLPKADKVDWLVQKCTEAGVSAVYISPSMFKMIGKLPEIEIGEYGEKVDITPIVNTLKGFYLLNTSDQSVIKRLNSDVKGLLGKGSYDLMMEAKNDGETIRFYTDGDDNIIRNFVMMALDGESATFISMDGLINREALEKMLAKLKR